MAPNYSSDQDLGDALREYFAAEAPSLRAPRDLWNTLEGRLEDPRRIPRMRRKVLAAASRYWFPVMATGGAVAAGAVLAVWVTTAGLGGGESHAATVAYEVTAAPRAARDGSPDGQPRRQP